MIELLATLKLASLTSTAALLLVLMLRKPMQHYLRPRAAYALWAFVPLATVVVLIPSPAKSMASQSLSATVLNESLAAVAVISHALPTAGVSFDASRWLLVLWALGVGVAFAWFLFQQRRFMLGLGQLSAVRENIVRAQTTIGCPALVGAWRPLIVLPVDFEQRYNADEQSLILAHERHHRSSGDAQSNVLCMALRCLFWFNPLVHFAAVHFRLDQELACDAAVIAHFNGRRRSYANAMLKTQLTQMKLPIGCYWHSNSAIAQRITLLREPLTARWQTVLGRSVALILVASGTYAAWAVQPARTIYATMDIANKRVQDLAEQKKASSASAPVRNTALGQVSKGAKSQTPAPRVSNKARPSARLLELAGANTGDDRQDRLSASARPIASNARTDALETGPLAIPDFNAADDVSDRQRLANNDRAPEEVPTYRETHPPRYPPEAIRERVQGDVVLRVHVDKDGNPQDAEIISLTPPTATNLASSSIAAVMNWKFHPALREGKSAPGIAMVPFSFRISGSPAATSAGAEGTHGKVLETRRASYRLMSAIDYPQNAAAAGLQGVVQLKILLASDGSVTSLNIDRVQPASAHVFAETAAASVKTWTFNPARTEGKDVVSKITVPVVFALQSDTASLGVRTPNGLDPVVVLPKG